MDLPVANGRIYEGKSHQNSSLLSDFYLYYTAAAKRRTRSSSRLGRTWK